MAIPATGTATTPKVGDVVDVNGKTAKNGSIMDKDGFMKLLVAQLKYQTPDSPMDSSQFMNQQAQFSMMEAIQNMSTDQTALLAAQRSVTATSMLGQKITALPTTTGAADIVGVVTGVKLGTDGPVLKIGDKEVPLASVKEVTKA